MENEMIGKPTTTYLLTMAWCGAHSEDTCDQVEVRVFTSIADAKKEADQAYDCMDFIRLEKISADGVKDISFELDPDDAGCDCCSASDYYSCVCDSAWDNRPFPVSP